MNRTNTIKCEYEMEIDGLENFRFIYLNSLDLYEGER